MGDTLIRINRKGGRDTRFNKHLGHRLRNLRKAHGYRIIDVKDMTGVSIELLSRIENGKSHMTVLELLAFTVIYETTLEELMEGLWGHLEIIE